MFPPFPVQKAHAVNLKLISLLYEGKITFTKLTKESLERQGQGIMLGTLVCRKADGSLAVLSAVSGISRQLTAGTEAAEKLKKSLTEQFAKESLSGENPSSTQDSSSPENPSSAQNPFSTGTQSQASVSDFIIVPPLVSPAEIEKALAQNDEEIHKLTEQINSLQNLNLNQLIQKRTQLTTESLLKVFDLYSFTDFNHSKITLNQIIKEHHNHLPPTGTGDCCAPKLLSYAFQHNLTPLSLDEVFYGKNTKNKINGQSYGPCDERCGYILPSILGLEILYRDDDIIVVNKQSGLLSVPGRTPDKQDCIVNRFKKLFPEALSINQPSVHRLDMETSGILVLAFNAAAHKELNRQFADGEVHKKYVAVLDGILEKAEGLAAPKHGEKEGRIELKFRLDTDNRPHQIYDEENGKTGITLWQNLGLVNYTLPDGSTKKCTKILFLPQTGRTHQLRLHSSDSHGFGLPIIGDTLYGTCLPGQRLMLHAQEIEFTHPVTKEKMHFECKAEF